MAILLAMVMCCFVAGSVAATVHQSIDAAMAETLLRDEGPPMSGNPQAKVTLVIFLDYQSGRSIVTHGVFGCTAWNESGYSYCLS